MKRQFERHFAGSDNAGIRAEIRRVADHNPACATEIRRVVLAIAQRIALTPEGLSTLATVAADYAASRASYEPRCDCHSCYQVSLGLLAR